MTVLAEKVAMHSEPLNGQAIGNALYGMQRFGDSLEARRLLAVLTPKIEQFEGVLSGQMAMFVLTPSLNGFVLISNFFLKCF